MLGFLHGCWESNSGPQTSVGKYLTHQLNVLLGPISILSAHETVLQKKIFCSVLLTLGFTQSHFHLEKRFSSFQKKKKEKQKKTCSLGDNAVGSSEGWAHHVWKPTEWAKTPNEWSPHPLSVLLWENWILLLINLLWVEMPLTAGITQNILPKNSTVLQQRFLYPKLAWSLPWWTVPPWVWIVLFCGGTALWVSGCSVVMQPPTVI